MTTLLEKIQKFLDENDQPSTLFQPTSEFPYERILIATENQKEQHVDFLEITALEMPKDVAQEESSNCSLIQFQFLLPVKVSAEYFHQISSALHFFNRLLHLPGFELDELTNQIIYRYVWFTAQDRLDASLFMQALGNVQLCFKLFSPFIIEIAKGKYQLEDIIQQVVTLTEKKS